MEKYILFRRYYSSAGKSGAHIRRVGLDRGTNKELLITHLKFQGDAGAKLADLLQVLPDLPRGQVQVLLREKRAVRRVRCVGTTSVARWYVDQQS